MQIFALLSTKKLIEDYMDEVVKQIEYIETTNELDQQTKLKLLSDTRQAFGCSALVLQGGTAFGGFKRKHHQSQGINKLMSIKLCITWALSRH